MAMNTVPKIALCGGGTGGHIAPALALAEEFSSRYGRQSVLFLCGGLELEREMIGGAGFDLVALPVARPGGGIARKTRSLASMAPALWAARSALKKFGATGVIGVGGYASLPGVTAARWLGRPVILLEANAVPGRVTRLLSRLAALCCAHLPMTTVLGCPAVVTGNPLRSLFRNAPARSQARAALGLDPHLPTLLVMGGSQGAQGINRALLAALPALEDFAGRIQLLHIAGKTEFEAASGAWSRTTVAHKCVSFTAQPHLWMAASDMALSRAGAGTISELMALGVPVLLAPYPHAADDHQRANARYVAACGAGVVVDETSLTAAKIPQLVRDYLLNDLRRIPLAIAARRLARPDAVTEIVELALQRFGFKQDGPTVEIHRDAA